MTIFLGSRGGGGGLLNILSWKLIEVSAYFPGTRLLCITSLWHRWEKD